MTMGGPFWARPFIVPQSSAAFSRKKITLSLRWTCGLVRYVAFDSFAADLVSGDNNGYADVFRAPNE